MNFMDFRAEGMQLATWSPDNVVQVWESSPFQEVSRLVHNGPVWKMAFSPDGRWMFTECGDSVARVWEISSGREVKRVTYPGKAVDAGFSPDGRWLGIAGRRAC